MNKEVKQLVRSIEHIEGVEMRNTGNGHLAVYKDEQFVCTIASTPSDRHWRENTLAKLRRAGVTPPNHPKGPSKLPADIMGVEDIRSRVKALPNRAAFARFLTVDMLQLKPELRTYKNPASAEASLDVMVHKNGGLSGWSHLLLDQAIREWERVRFIGQPVVAETQLEAHEEPEPITESARAAVVLLDVPPKGKSLSAVTMVELAREHEELTSRIVTLAERAKSLSAQLDELVSQRENLSAEILSRLSETEGRP